MISTHLTKSTWLHQIPASIKLLLLSLSTVLTSFIKDINFGLLLLIFSFILFASLGRQAHEKLKVLLKSFGTFIILIGMFQALFIPINIAALMSVKMLSLILLADLISITTSLSEFKRIILKLLFPLRIFGVNTNKISLTMTLSLRLIHVYIALWKKLDLSLKSRLLLTQSYNTRKKTQNLRIKKLVTPFLFNAHNLTLNIADALQARIKK